MGTPKYPKGGGFRDGAVLDAKLLVVEARQCQKAWQYPSMGLQLQTPIWAWGNLSRFATGAGIKNPMVEDCLMAA